MTALPAQHIDDRLNNNDNDRRACRSFLSVTDLNRDEWVRLLDLADRLKADPAGAAGALDNRQIAMIFEKPSLRTRVSFDAGIARMGGRAMYLDESRSRLGEREPIKDYARNLERYVDGIVARVHEHTALAELARHCSIPVVNALSDHEHPCQAAADIMTLRERLGTLDDARLAYLGDGNNVCHSLMLLAATMGVSTTVITPPNRAPDTAVARKASDLAAASGASVELSHDPAAAEGHHAVYTDKWVSMGSDNLGNTAQDVFAPYRVDDALMALAAKGVDTPPLFMHCLPATRGEEVTAPVIDGPNSAVYDQAENRMHAQNALLLILYGLDTA